MTVEERRRRRFTENFRKEQVKKIESGELSVEEVSRLYEIQQKNVRLWLKKYGIKKIAEQIIISTSKDYNRVKDLEQEVAKLKQIIADQQIELIKTKSVVLLAEEKLGTSFEKK